MTDTAYTLELAHQTRAPQIKLATESRLAKLLASTTPPTPARKVVRLKAVWLAYVLQHRA
jgi:hypothetical protein